MTMLDASQKIVSNRPSLMVRPTTIKPAGQQPLSQPQIIVIPQSMLATNGIKTVFSIADNQATRIPVTSVSRVIKPATTVPLVSQKPAPVKTVSLKRPLPASSPSYSSSDDDSKADFYSDESEAKIRKRANLDHLSLEEKMMRRKLKNRVAAQNARDKKRMKMDDMEKAIRQLQQQNKILAKQNEDLLALNRRLMAENTTLKSAPSQTTVVVKQEETEIPCLPSPPPSSQTPPMSSDEDDDVMLSTALPMEAVDTSTVAVNLNAAVTDVADRRSPVSHRLRAPAEPQNVLQQQEQSRCQAAERPPSNASVSAPEQLACLLWMCLLNPSQRKSSQTTSPPEETQQGSDRSSLPFKKRSSWWQQPCPPAIT